MTYDYLNLLFNSGKSYKFENRNCLIIDLIDAFKNIGIELG